MPALIFLLHAFNKNSQREIRVRYADTTISRSAIGQVRGGMSRDELLRLAPRPFSERHFYSRGGRRESLNYTDGSTLWEVRLRDNLVVDIRSNADCDVAEDNLIFATVFQLFFLRLAVFFGCVFVFLNLFRGEVLDKTLHFYFLAPIRREIVVAGKFLAGVCATTVIFTVSVALQLWVLYGHLDPEGVRVYLNDGGGWGDLLTYLGITVLACCGYGGVFLAAGAVIRNPLIPAASILVWESINGILPAFLRKISVIYYLKSLCPIEIPLTKGVPPPLALLALNVDPASAAASVFGIAGVTVLLVWLAARFARKMEISYAAD
jgi:ABC-type transport system involved in multi-copper enzyme maturation permease subunit